ncbi:hypothetical protein SKAU_G00231840 [Synaphobranchus kaupii]|uniref:Uncharacterized protein n=1 Tax=Synaphobranchus kaupii TaxID=118154 RepID=A0A9Q1F5U0_SYNKA|nr:hypothetical protein SKAU_G00231840 [Synaphobranchus kaupii]
MSGGSGRGLRELPGVCCKPVLCQTPAVALNVWRGPARPRCKNTPRSVAPLSYRGEEIYTNFHKAFIGECKTRKVLRGAVPQCLSPRCGNRDDGANHTPAVCSCPEHSLRSSPRDFSPEA